MIIGMNTGFFVGSFVIKFWQWMIGNYISGNLIRICEVKVDPTRLLSCKESANIVEGFLSFFTIRASFLYGIRSGNVTLMGQKHDTASKLTRISLEK